MKFIKIFACITLFLFIFPINSFGAMEIAEQNKQPSKFYFFPAIFYTTDTGWGGGGIFFYYPNLKAGNSDQKQDVINATLIGTEKGQITGTFSLSKYFNQDKQWLLLNTSLVNFPDYFYGIGPNTTSGMQESYTSVGISGLQLLVGSKRSFIPWTDYSLCQFFNYQQEAGWSACQR
jgi:hypothetical protein